MFVMLSRMFIAVLWSPAVKGLTSSLLFVMSYCDFVTFPNGILGQVWYLIVLIPDLCHLSYFDIDLSVLQIIATVYYLSKCAQQIIHSWWIRHCVIIVCQKVCFL